MTLSRTVLLLALSSGCASVSQTPRSAGEAAQTPRADGPSMAVVAGGTFTAAETSGPSKASISRDTRARASTTPPSARVAAPLRHFYLLSPGPNAKLVITRSDL